MRDWLVPMPFGIETVVWEEPDDLPLALDADWLLFRLEVLLI